MNNPRPDIDAEIDGETESDDSNEPLSEDEFWPEL